MENVELDVQQKDKEGLSPVALAEKNGHRKCADYLKIAVSKVFMTKYNCILSRL